MRARRGVWCVRCEREGASCVTVCVGRYARGAEVCGEFGLGWTRLRDAVRGPAAECGPAVVLPRIYSCYDVVPALGGRAMASGNYDSRVYNICDPWNGRKGEEFERFLAC